jgi:hypothetical protein
MDPLVPGPHAPPGPEACTAEGHIVLQPITRAPYCTGERAGSDCHTYMGTDCGLAGSGTWHSLSGLMEEKESCLDFARCYPLMRAEYQPCCVGAVIRARGAGSLKVELKSADERVLWWGTGELALGNEWQELAFAWEPGGLRRVKSLHWMADPAGAHVELDSLSLQIRMPALPFEQEVFLLSYAKLARLYSQERGTVRERGCQPAGKQDSIPASGLFVLATCVAWKMGLIKLVQAEQVLHKVQAAVSALERRKGLLPRFVYEEEGSHRINKGAEYSTLGTSVYYHSLLLAAQLLWDGKSLASTIKAIKEIDFDRLRDSAGYLAGGVKDDGITPTEYSWREWGGEAVLCLLLEQMATGSLRRPDLKSAGTVPGGVGLKAEIGSLFYLDFSTSEVDAVTGVDWLGARRALLEEQKAFFRRRWPKPAAARLGLYGLSYGEDPAGEGYVVSGTRMGGKTELICPHYLLMSGQVESDPAAVYDVLRAMRANGLAPPWGLVGGFPADLAHPPLLGALSAGLETIAAYHLWARASGRPDEVYAAAEHCGLLREAIRVFYPADKTW